MKVILMAENLCKDFLWLSKKRRTTYEFSEKMVSDSKISKILESARWASSSHNSQPWQFIVVKNKKTIDKLMRVCTYGGFYAEPPVLIGVVLEPIYIKQQALLQGDLSSFAETHKYLNIGMAVSSIVHEATAEGVDSCILSPDVKKAGEILSIPKRSELVLIVGLGYAADSAFYPPRLRLDFTQVVSYEKYENKVRQ